MLRVRIDGGAVTTEQLTVLGEMSQTYARDTADITDRQNIQYHWIRVEDMPAIWAKLEGAGLTTMEACGDSPRVILGSPGRRHRRGRGHRRAPRPSRRSSAASSATRSSRTCRASSRPPSPACRTWRTRCTTSRSSASHHPEHGPGFDLWVGGGLSTNPMIGQRLGAWVPLDEVRRRVGRRDQRLPRLRLPPAAPPRADQVPGQGLGRGEVPRGAGDRVPEAPAARRPGARGARPAVRPRRRAPAAGRQRSTSAPRRSPAGCPARRWSRSRRRPSGSARTGSGSPRSRSWSCSTSPKSEVDGLRAELTKLGLHDRPVAVAARRDGLHRHRVLQARDRRDQGPRRGPGGRRWRSGSRTSPARSTAPISVHINGCPNSCARIQTADIGLKGQIVTDADGNQVEGFQVHLGGGLGLDAGFGRKLRGHKVTGAELTGYVERVVRNFVASREPGERFAQWVARADGGGPQVTERATPVLLPVLRRRGPAPAGGAARRVAVHRLPAGVHRQVRRPQPRHRTSGGDTDDHHHRPAGRSPSTRPPNWPRRPPTEALAWTAATFGDRFIVASNMQDAVLIDLAVQREVRCGRAVPGDRLPLRRDDRHPRRGRADLPGHPDRQRRGRAVGRRPGGASSAC